MQLNPNDRMTEKQFSYLQYSEHEKNIEDPLSKKAKIKFFSYVRGYENGKTDNEELIEVEIEINIRM